MQCLLRIPSYMTPLFTHIVWIVRPNIKRNKGISCYTSLFIKVTHIKLVAMQMSYKLQKKLTKEVGSKTT